MVKVNFHNGAHVTLSGKLPTRYVREKEIGHGTFGTVYRVKDMAQNPPILYAVKVVKWDRAWVPSTPDGGSSLQELESPTLWEERVDGLNADLAEEAKVLQSLSHQHILAFKGMIHPDSKGHSSIPLAFPAMLTELCDGTLYDLYKDFPNNPVKPYAFWMFRQMCCALDYLHGKGLIHQDIKPKNIFFKLRPIRPRTRRNNSSSRWLFKLGDFGMCRTIKESQGYNPGTRAYMAPEHKNTKPCPQSDLYSLYVTVLVTLNINNLAYRLNQQSYSELRKMIKEAMVVGRPRLGTWEFLGRTDPLKRRTTKEVWDKVWDYSDFNQKVII